MSERQADEGPARLRVCVGGALALEVRLEEEALGARRHRRGLGEDLVVRRSPRVCRHHCSDPAAESITPIACQVPGTAWQNVCRRASGSGRYSSQSREDDAGRAENHGQEAGPDNADAERAGRLVAGAGDLGRLVGGRQPLARQLERVEHLLAPAPVGDVEEQRPGGVGDVDRALAGAAVADVVLRQQDVRGSARTTPARAFRSQSSFGAVKPVSARLPVSRIRRSRPTRSSISAHSAAVRWSFQRIAGRIALAAVVEDDEPVHLARPADRRRLDRELVRARPASRVHQSSGSCSAQPRLRRRERVLVLGAREDLARRRERERLDAARADVDPDERPHAASPTVTLRGRRTRARRPARRPSPAGPHGAPARRSSPRPRR